MSDKIHATGLAECAKFMADVPQKMANNIMRGALRAGGNVFKNAAKAKVSVKLGALRDSIRVSTRNKGGIVTASVKAGDKKAFYWRFVEFGTRKHLIVGKRDGLLIFGNFKVKSAKHPGAKPKPFMRPTFDANGPAAVVAVGEAIKKRFTKQGLDTADIEINAER